MAARWITRGCITVFVAGIAGLIVSSIAGNNNGLVLTIGGAITLAAVVLITVSTVTATRRIPVFDEADAERVERRIVALVESGADEAELRALVRDVRRLGAG